LICPNYDLCSKCFEKRRISDDHLINHPVVRFDEPGILFGQPTRNGFNLNDLKRTYKDEVHSGINCDICDRNPIKGLRFKCDLCSGFDVCLACYEAKHDKKDKGHTLEHPLIVIGKEVSLQVETNEIELGRVLGEGGFGKVYKAKYKNKTVACKIMSFNQQLVKSYLRELAAYSEIKGIVSCLINLSVRICLIYQNQQNQNQDRLCLENYKYYNN
jgi:hypothetical protein